MTVCDYKKNDMYGWDITYSWILWHGNIEGAPAEGWSHPLSSLSLKSPKLWERHSFITGRNHNECSQRNQTWPLKNAKQKLFLELSNDKFMEAMFVFRSGAMTTSTKFAVTATVSTGKGALKKASHGEKVKSWDPGLQRLRYLEDVGHCHHLLRGFHHNFMDHPQLWESMAIARISELHTSDYHRWIGARLLRDAKVPQRIVVQMLLLKPRQFFLGA